MFQNLPNILILTLIMNLSILMLIAIINHLANNYSIIVLVEQTCIGICVYIYIYIYIYVYIYMYVSLVYLFYRIATPRAEGRTPPETLNPKP